MKLTIFIQCLAVALLMIDVNHFPMASTVALINTNRQNVLLEEDLLMAWRTDWVLHPHSYVYFSYVYRRPVCTWDNQFSLLLKCIYLEIEISKTSHRGCSNLRIFKISILTKNKTRNQPCHDSKVHYVYHQIVCLFFFFF